MHLHWERLRNPGSYSDCTILSLSWMGRVPDHSQLSSTANNAPNAGNNGPNQGGTPGAGGGHGVGSAQQQPSSSSSSNSNNANLDQTNSNHNPQHESWKLNRINYYQEGWLSTGNIRGIVGVTHTTCQSRSVPVSEFPTRMNYNLRGHRSEVTLVKWNEPYQKLATCDSSGIIFVWIKYEGRWSIELINDRNTQVTDFSWSHDGRMALICYMDGFVLVGSVAGQRYWSSMLNLDGCTITCGIWTPNDQQVIFGTSSGHMLVIDISGNMVAQVTVHEGVSILCMSWSCEKFKMEDTEENRSQGLSNGVTTPNAPPTTPSSTGTSSKNNVLAVCFRDGSLFIMKSYDDLFPIIIRTGLLNLQVEWSQSGDILAVAGHRQTNFTAANSTNRDFENWVKFYTPTGLLRYSTKINYGRHPVTAMTWGHQDKRLFIATGPCVHIAWITKSVPRLQLLSRLTIYRNLKAENDIETLPLPRRLTNSISNLFGQTIRCYLPDPNDLRNFVSKPPKSGLRLHCTMIRHDEDLANGNSTYVLYLEYLGGLVPILKGKRSSKLKPEFLIFDPQKKTWTAGGLPASTTSRGGSSSSSSTRGSNAEPYNNNSSGFSSLTSSSAEEDSDGTDYDQVSALASPRLLSRHRRRFRRRRRRDRNQSQETNQATGANSLSTRVDLYPDELPEDEKLILVTSNIWGTKFKVLGLVPWLPSVLGSVSYRTSLLHLQPRQMTITIKELGSPRLITQIEGIEDPRACGHPHPHQGGTCCVNANNKSGATNCQSKRNKSTDHNQSSSGFASSEDEDALANIESNLAALDDMGAIPIAPMTPRKNLRYSTSYTTPHHHHHPHPHQSHHHHHYTHQTSAVSPERRLNYRLVNNQGHTSIVSTHGSPSQIGGNENHFGTFISGLNEELLTLQFSGDPEAGCLQSYTLEMTGPPPVTTSSISTQTSFQSLSDLITCIANSNPNNNNTNTAGSVNTISTRSTLHPNGMLETSIPFAHDTQDGLSHNGSRDRPPSPCPPGGPPIPRSSYQTFNNEFAHSSGNMEPKTPHHHVFRRMTTDHSHMSNHPTYLNQGIMRSNSISAGGGSPSSTPAGQNVISPSSPTHSASPPKTMRSAKINARDSRKSSLSYLVNGEPISQFSPIKSRETALVTNYLQSAPSTSAAAISSATPMTSFKLIASSSASQNPILSQAAATSVGSHYIHHQSPTHFGLGPTSHYGQEQAAIRLITSNSSNDFRFIDDVDDEKIEYTTPFHNNYQQSQLTNYHRTMMIMRMNSQPTGNIASTSDSGAAFTNIRATWTKAGPANNGSMSITTSTSSGDLEASQGSPTALMKRLTLDRHLDEAQARKMEKTLLSLDYDGDDDEEDEDGKKSGRVRGLLDRDLMKNMLTGNQKTNNYLKRTPSPSSSISSSSCSSTAQNTNAIITNPIPASPLHHARRKTSIGSSTMTQGTELTSLPSNQKSISSNTSMTHHVSHYHHHEWSSSAQYRSKQIHGPSALSSSPFIPSVSASGSGTATGMIRSGLGRSNYSPHPHQTTVTSQPTSTLSMQQQHQQHQYHNQLYSLDQDEIVPPTPPPMIGMRHRGSLPENTSNHALSTILSSPSHNPYVQQQHQHRSLPASPLLSGVGGTNGRRPSRETSSVRSGRLNGRSLFYSPMVIRRVMKQKLSYLDCSSEDDNSTEDDDADTTGSDFRDLNSFQRATIKKKMKVKRRGSKVQPEHESGDPALASDTLNGQKLAYREFVLHNKAPLWNEVSQVYQLDFGGRVTQESAKNFQIEYQGKQVMQFGRIDGNAYTLDFQWPFSAIQALAVALANVTQRLK